MQSDDLKALLKALSTLTAAMEKREASLRELINQQLQTLHHGVQKTNGDVNRLLENSLPRISQLSKQALDNTIGAAMQTLEHSAAASIDKIQTATHLSLQAQQESGSRMRRAAWITLAAVIAATLIPLLGAVVLLGNYKDAITRHRIEAALLQAYNSADVTLCDGRLCANVDAMGKKMGDRKQYLPVESRP